MKINKVSGNQNIVIKISPNAIIRGILGHLLSAKSFHERSVLDDIFATSVINKEQAIPNTLQFYVVYYESEEIRVIRDLMLLMPSSMANPILLNTLKIKPFAFLIANAPFLNNTVMNWTNFFAESYNKKFEVNINTHIGCPNTWPENDNSFVRLLGKSASESIIGCEKEIENSSNKL